MHQAYIPGKNVNTSVLISTPIEVTKLPRNVTWAVNFFGPFKGHGIDGIILGFIPKIFRSRDTWGHIPKEAWRVVKVIYIEMAGRRLNSLCPNLSVQ